MGFFKHTGKIAEFFKTSQQYVYKKGDIILREGDIPSGVYYVERGFVKAYSTKLDGSENLRMIYKPGEVFPGAWIFGHSIDDVSYQAIEPVSLRRKPKEAILQLLDTDSEALREAFELSINFNIILLNRIENLELTFSYSRVINRLLLLAWRFGEKKGNQIIIVAPITHTDIANSINMSRETASRELEKLKQKNIISEVKHVFIIKDIKKLEEELALSYEQK